MLMHRADVPAEVERQTECPVTVRAGQRLRTRCSCRALAAAIRRSPVRHQNDPIADPWQGDVETIDEFLFSFQESSLLGGDRFKGFHEVFGHICLPLASEVLMTDSLPKWVERRKPRIYGADGAWSQTP